jgi:hypothetical protein
MSEESSKLKFRTATQRLKQDLRRLMRSMDFVSRHPALVKDGPDADRFAEIYRQLGLAWEFLGLQCRHNEGWRKVRQGETACRVCGLIRGVDESWLLLPRKGKKVVGRRAVPNSKRTFPTRKAATVVNDTIEFHGAKLNVEVLNQHRCDDVFFRKMDWTVAADRLVRLEESGVEVRLDTHLVTIEIRKRRRGEMPPYSHFVWELPRKFLKKFPVMLEFDKRNRFTGVVIFKPREDGAEKPKSTRKN